MLDVLTAVGNLARSSCEPPLLELVLLEVIEDAPADMGAKDE
jgi:hypothetical protein